MKFYSDKIDKSFYKIKIATNKLTCVYNKYTVIFYKNGKYHNYKNAAYVNKIGYKSFYLNGTPCGKSNKFTKESWRRFVKLQFLK
jgi:hypothetical protein